MKTRLIDAVIDKLQYYFGIALRRHIGDLKRIEDVIIFSMFHITSSGHDNYHQYGPTTPDTWCQYNRDQLYKQSFTSQDLDCRSMLLVQ